MTLKDYKVYQDYLTTTKLLSEIKEVEPDLNDQVFDLFEKLIDRIYFDSLGLDIDYIYDPKNRSEISTLEREYLFSCLDPIDLTKRTHNRNI